MRFVGRLLVGMDELVEHWTVLDDELELVAGKRGATRLATGAPPGGGTQ